MLANFPSAWVSPPNTMLAVCEFRCVGLFEIHIGPGTRFRVTVKQPAATNEIQFGKPQE